ncbi:hypothetical protein E4U30_004726 [Claviceps sp. LM220 group G6]|nr:hypothetical protein E4U30_004726 [Claviceps sp. LM220 group G6]
MINHFPNLPQSDSRLLESPQPEAKPNESFSAPKRCTGSLKSKYPKMWRRQQISKSSSPNDPKPNSPSSVTFSISIIRNVSPIPNHGEVPIYQSGLSRGFLVSQSSTQSSSQPLTQTTLSSGLSSSLQLSSSPPPPTASEKGRGKARLTGDVYGVHLAPPSIHRSAGKEKLSNNSSTFMIHIPG